MGINVDTMDFFYDSLYSMNIKNLNGVWLLELGNQGIRNPVKEKYKIKTGKSKEYFLSLRCNHHSIDWNGLDGAIPLDLCEPIPIPKFIKGFDIITDFGDMEHVRGGAVTQRDEWQPGEGQWLAWQNIHDMGKAGCLYIHTLPMVGSFKNHGSYHYTFDFFNNLCKANNYKILELRDNQNDKRHHGRDYVFCSYIKQDDKPFEPDWEIFKTWIHR
jgi:hypothetical protein